MPFSPAPPSPCGVVGISESCWSVSLPAASRGLDRSSELASYDCSPGVADMGVLGAGESTTCEMSAFRDRKEAVSDGVVSVFFGSHRNCGT